MFRYFPIILLFCISLLSGATTVNAQNKPSGFAKIKFVDTNEDHAKTYLCRLAKGNIQDLKYELQNGSVAPVVTMGGKSKSEQEEYVDGITDQKLTKRNKGNSKRASQDLLGNYEVKSEKSLKEVQEKKQSKLREERESEKNNPGNYNVFKEEKSVGRPNSYLSKNYRIRGRRIQNGHTFKKRAGYVCFIIKYKIKEGKFVNTYVNIVEDYIKEGSKYDLKYHGNASNRKYYLEYVPGP